MALDGTITVLKGLLPVAKMLPFFGTQLEGGIETAVELCEYAAGVKDNKEETRNLAERVAKDYGSIVNTLQGADEDTRKELMDALEEVWKVMVEIKKWIKSRAEQNKKAKVIAVIRKDKVAGKLKGLTAELEDATKRFMTIAQIQEKIALHTLVSDADYNTLNNLGPISHGYLDAKGTRSGCLENTRVKLLEKIHSWIDHDDDQNLVFWLKGLAGTGKSTIATTIAERLKKNNKAHGRTYLAAWFFCSRQDVERRQPANVLLTLVYQVALLDHGLRTKICTALRKQADLPKDGLDEQIISLLQEPLQKLNISVILMVDALDECEQYGGKLLSLLAIAAKAVSGRLRLLITSRPERRIEQMFQQIDPTLYALHDMEKGVVQADILLYLHHHFAQIKQDLFLQDLEWPSSEDLDILVDRSGTLFIYAATVVKFIAQTAYDPQELLEIILTQLVVDPRQGFPYQDVDLLYTQVLRAAVSNAQGKAQEDARADRISATVGTIILLQTPLSANALVTLLNSKEAPVKHDLYCLSAMLLIPSNPDLPVEIFHPSFPDFLTDARRCTDHRFLLNQQQTHTQIALCCLQLMNKELHFNMTGRSTLPYVNSTLSAEEIQTTFSEVLQYACKYWMHHVSLASKDNETLVSELAEFVEQTILNWVEAASLLSVLPMVITTLPQVEQWTSGITNLTNVGTMLYDTQRICQGFYPTLEKWPMDVYHSVMALGPEIPVQRFHGQLPPGWHTVQLISEKSPDWDPLLHVIKTASPVFAVSCSRDGKYIASGLYDGTVRIWNAVTGGQISVLEGHTNIVRSCSFSPDSMYIVSGASDSTVRIWDTVTGGQLLVLKDHTHALQSCSFSPDGKYIVSSSYDKTVRICGAVTGEQLLVLRGHTSFVHSSSFSPDGEHILSGSHDGTVRIWDAVTGGELLVIKGHTSPVKSCSFSPDGKYIASGLWDTTVRIWNAVTGEQLSVLEGHSMPVESCSFSPDGKYIVSGALDYTVRIWDTVTGGQLLVLKDHTSFVQSCSFSPDGKHIVSGSNDMTIRIWDAVTGRPVLAQAHTENVYSCSFSLAGKHIVSGSDDETVRIWDTVPGGQVSVLLGHTARVTSCSFSPSGNHIVSGSQDYTLRIWDAVTGGEVSVLEGHDGAVNSCSFSPDSKHIVSGSDDNTVRIWGAVIIGQVSVLRGHTAMVTSCSFSPDGKHIVSGSYDSTVRIWDAVTSQQVSVLDASDIVTSCSFSSNGKHIISVSRCDTVKIWDVPTEVMKISDAPTQDCITSISCSHLYLQHLPGTNIILLCSPQTETPHPFDDISSCLPSSTIQTVWLNSEGFLYVNSQLICWLPAARCPGIPDVSECVPMSMFSHGEKTMIVLGSETGLVTILDVTAAMSE